ncbi:MAG TPA: acetyl-CoA carboxylase biotin carboxyl carrier protein [Bacteroidota bacterium]|nr:acetyl-CoA carboxylase biotin carboxyl carrier protein [Bacteroidota bacterium]
MDLIYVKKLIKLLSESAVDEIEIEEEGKKIRVVKHGNTVLAGAPMLGQVPMMVQPPAGPVASIASPAMHAAQAEVPPTPPDTSKYHEIKSPIVGTFYRSPAPDAAPFVQIGTSIAPGTVLCIVEAMKLMNEIESDVTGKIVKVMVENGQPVEYDQTLFLVEAA